MQQMSEAEVQHVQHLNRIMLDWNSKGYCKQESIHSSEAIKFSKSVLKIDDWSCKTLERGLALETVRPVPDYREGNNMSARKNIEVLREKFVDWEAKGKVVEVKDPPRIINPMSVVAKYDGEKKRMKYRPVIDMSRHINPLMEDRKVKLADLSYFEPLYVKGSFGVTWDFTSMYHQLMLTKGTSELFGCAIEQADKTFKYYKFKYLMFGTKPAVYIMTWLLKPSMNYLRDNSIKAGIFIDDGMALNTNRQVLEVETKFIITMFENAGWDLNLEKSNLVPSQKVLYQGFYLDFQQMKYFLPKWKSMLIRQRITELLVATGHQKQVKAKEIESVVGKTISCRKSHGPAVLVGLRHVQHEVGRKVMHLGPECDPDWDVNLTLDDQSRNELKYVRDILKDETGYPFPVQGEAKVFTLDEVDYCTDEAYGLEDSQYRVFASDASDKVAFIYEAGSFKLVEEFAFTKAEQATSSGQRELLAIHKTLRQNREEMESQKGRVYWITDSQNVHGFMKRGSRKADIQKIVLDIKLLEKEMGIRIITIWKPRTTRQIVLADLGSKGYLSTDEWGIDNRTFKQIQKYIGLEVTVDGFATSQNRKTEKFFSKYPQCGSAGIDFFAQKLSPQEVYWICPPVKLVLTAINHILATENRVLAYVSFPEWKSANYWPIIKQGNKYAPFVRAVYVSDPKYKAYNENSKMFNGRETFRFLTILINNMFVNNNIYRN